MTLEERFWAKVDKSGDCWEWAGVVNSGGYGSIRVDGKMVGAHRVSWEIHNGLIVEMDGADYRGTCVLHKCDNPSCVNPNHLFLGVHLDNMEDKSRKGRAANPKGADSSSSKLTDNMVLIARAFYATAPKGKKMEVQQRIADAYKVSQRVIRRVVNRETWSHI